MVLLPIWNAALDRFVRFKVTGLPLPLAVVNVTVLVVAPPIVAIGSLNVTVTLSPASALPAVPPTLFVDDIEIGTGPAPSAGAVAANEP